MSKGKFIGWQGITLNAGKFVEAEDGFEYVCQQVGIEVHEENALTDDFREMLIEWYFSGNWIEVYKEEE